MLGKFLLHPMITKNIGCSRVPKHVMMNRACVGEWPNASPDDLSLNNEQASAGEEGEIHIRPIRLRMCSTKKVPVQKLMMFQRVSGGAVWWMLTQ